PALRRHGVCHRDGDRSRLEGFAAPSDRRRNRRDHAGGHLQDHGVLVIETGANPRLAAVPRAGLFTTEHDELRGYVRQFGARALAAHKDLGSYYLYRFGTEDQRKRWVAPAVEGRLITALAVTEPEAGSDVGAIRTRAVRDGDGWRLSGAKTFITNGPIADLVVV